MKRLLPGVLVLLLAMGVGPAPAASEGQKPAPANIILLSVDTLRADRLSAYGYKFKTSPNIDKLLASGTMFTDAITNVPLTTPSFATVFTGRYPHETGAIRNGIPMVDGVPTLATILKKHGYNTAAVLSNWPLKRHLSNLDQGFDFYEDDFHEKRWLFFNDERDAKGVTECALDWLKTKPKEPFFAWVHYSDPHAPYEAHGDYKFASGSINSSNYDSEVAYTDHYIGKLLAVLDKAGLRSRSLIVFMSDHGESLGEHDYTGHGRNVYQPGLQVPLAVIGPGLPAGKREPTPVQLLDLAPTILSYAGISVPGDMHGDDLMPLVRGEGAPAARTLYFETYSGAAPQVPGAEKSLDKPLWVGMKDGGVKTMFSVRYQRWEQYNLGSDPGELTSLVKLGDPGFKSDSDKVLAWYGKWEGKTVVGSVDSMTDEDRERFRALGYIDGP